MLRKWVFYFSLVFLAHCQTSLDSFDPDALPDEEDTQGDAADGTDAADAIHDPRPDDAATDVPPDYPVDVQPDNPVDIVPDDVIVDVPVDDVIIDDAPIDIPVDDVLIDDVLIDDVSIDDMRPDDGPPDIVPDDVVVDDIRPDDVVVDDIRPDDVTTDTFERCDNAFDDDGDGRIDCMDSDCLLAANCADTCYPLSSITCGSSITGTNLDPYATDRVLSHSCTAIQNTGPEVAYTFTLTERRSVTILLTGLSADLDLYLLGNSAARCDSTDCLAYSIAATTDDDRIHLALELGTYYILVDGYNEAVSSFNLSLACAPPEVCDNLADDDGDGFADCADAECAEFPGCFPYCNPVAFVNCGTLLSSGTTASGSTNIITTYSCTTFEEAGPEIAYAFMALAGASVTFTIDSLSTTMLDLFVLSDDSGNCNPNLCLDYSATDDATDSVTITASAGSVYYVVIDGYASASGTFRLGATCY